MMIPAEASGAFALGLSTSIGPCAAPRYLALIGAIAPAQGARRWLHAASFMCGLGVSYAALASLGFVFAAALSASHLLYAGLAAGFCASGTAMAVTRRRCGHAAPARPRLGQPFLAGAACGLVVSPCCTPVVLQGGLMAAGGSAGAAATLLAAFLAGHAAPVGVASVSGSVLLHRLRGTGVGDAISTVAAGCTVALGLYYGCAA